MPLGFITRHNVDPGGEGVVLLNEHVNEVNDRATPVRRRRENRRNMRVRGTLRLYTTYMSVYMACMT